MTEKVLNYEGQMKSHQLQKTAETKAGNKKIKNELQKALAKIRSLENEMEQLDCELKRSKKSGTNKMGPWWHLHCDPVPESIKTILKADCKFCRKTFKHLSEVNLDQVDFSLQKEITENTLVLHGLTVLQWNWPPLKTVFV